jgi:heme/copper-type cytochrome/quinol oxidase subunit 1
LSYFSAASMIIVVPSSVAVFAWVATIWTGRPVFNTVYLFLTGFVLLFVIGGVSGFMTAAVPVDWQLNSTYFVVAHLHYVLIGINVFPVIGGIYYWFPKVTGRLMNETLGKWSFWVMFIGFNIAFFPMHIVGFQGMPRRIYTYNDQLGWGAPNLVISIGAFIFAAGIFLFLINLAISWKGGSHAGANPWDAPSLEWSTSSPPPVYNFSVIPVVASRYPLWEDRLLEKSDRSWIRRGMLLDKGRETVGTTMLDAEPDVILRMPGDSYLPFLLTLGMTAFFVALLLHLWWGAGISALAMLVICVAWLWPRPALGQVAGEVHG